MDYSLPLKAFLNRYFDTGTLNGAEKYLVLAALLSNGSQSKITHKEINKAWSKTVLKIVANPSQYHRARNEGWVQSTGTGVFTVTDQGYSHLENLRIDADISSVSPTSSHLEIFTMGKMHSFDKFLRSVFASAKKEVLIADAYVDDTVFDNLLDEINEALPINLLYSNHHGAFNARAKRFKGQYKQFTAKHHPGLHDRFMIIDDAGYIIGPSLKDAARKSPATVVRLGNEDTNKLRQLFISFWSQAR